MEQETEKMYQIVKRIGILFGIFATALLIYFMIGNRNRSGAEETVYVALQDASLPTVYAETCGRTMNRMAGYRQEMDSSVAGELLTLIPEDRKLVLDIQNREDAITAIHYDVRSMDRQRLIERTDLENWTTTDSGIQAQLPIQNLIARDQEYLLQITLETEQHGSVYYYTRILWTDSARAQAMVDLAVNFSEKTFDPAQARELASYLETNTSQDENSYHRTTIHSSFSRLTWGKLGMQPSGEFQVALRELDGAMSSVQVKYPAVRQDEETGESEIYEVEENFTMKWNELRIYLMDYERDVNQIFSGKDADYSGKRILLGITDESRVEARKSPSGSVIAYRAGRELWTYDQKSGHAVKVFSFRGKSGDVRENDSRHDTRILSVGDDGSIEFLVYGYMNRGEHEGNMGIAGYVYQTEANALEERFFIPYSGSFTELEEDLNQLVCLNPSGMLYLYLKHAVYGIDLESRENMVVADRLEKGSYAVSVDQKRFAWQSGRSQGGAGVLYLMDLETGQSQEIDGGVGENVRVLGFVGRDLVYGTARESDRWIVNGRTEEEPMYNVKIVNDQMEVETTYQKEGYYISRVSVEESRIHLDRVVRSGDQSYAPTVEDTIVCNADIGQGRMDGIGWYASPTKGRVYFVQLDGEVRSRSIRTSVPDEISYEKADMLNLETDRTLGNMEFYAYASGQLRLVTMDFASAIQTAYEGMGYVTDSYHRLLWSRVDRSVTRTIRDPQTAFAPLSRHLDEFAGSQKYADGVLVLDGRGCSMMQMLYFIDQGTPVVAYTENGGYLLLCGYDAYNVTIFNPATGEMYKAGLNDSTEYFRRLGNDFVCALVVE